jgi:hypothetical protein
MIGWHKIVQHHRKQRSLTPTFSTDVGHKEKCPRSREGIFSSTAARS